MKLTDLRDELNARAATTDETPDLLPGVRRKITQTKRRRTAGAAGAIGGLAVIAAFAFGILPGLTTSTPQPADDTPKDYVKDGVILPAFQGADRLEKGWIGDVGENTLDFSWTPDSGATRFAAICTSTARSTQYLTIKVNAYVVGTSSCISDPNLDDQGNGISVPANSSLWLAAPAGQAAHVVVQLTDESGTAQRDTSAQVALGIYQTAVEPPEGPPVQAPPTSTDDYLKDGIRYRDKIGGDTLVAAKVADRGKNWFDFTFKAPGGQLSLHDFCTATSPGTDPEYQLAVWFNNELVSKGTCSNDTTDGALGSSLLLPKAPPAGQQVRVVVQLQHKDSRPVMIPSAWIGMGIYAKGEQRSVGGSKLDEVVEYGGRNYRLTDVKSGPAGAGHLELATPADTPFLVSYGNSGPYDENATVRLTGIGRESADTAGGTGTAGVAARPAGTAKVTITGNPQTTGQLILGVYLPQ
jgi:hypothetical protein